MKTLKSFIRRLAVALSFAVCSSGAFAQIPVTDLLGLAQDIQQVASWVQQYQQMVEQLQNQKNQLEAVTGSRGMSLLASNMTRQELPQDFVGTYDKLRSMGKYGASNDARAIYDTIRVYDCATKYPTNQNQRLMCEARAMAAPENVSLINRSIGSAQQRQNQLKQMQASIDTSDAKAAQDLNNRISLELAHLQNEKLMLDMALQQRKEQLELTQQQAAEEGARRLSRGSGGGTNPFNLN